MFRSIKTKLGVLLLTFVILVAAIITSTYWLIYTQKEYGLLINLSGRQRMLSQKMSKELYVYTHNRTKVAKNRAAESKDLFDQTLKKFKYGGEIIDAEGLKVTIIGLPPTKEIKEICDASSSLWNIYKTKVDIILSEDIDSAKVEEAIGFIRKNNPKLLNQMNLLTVLLQKDYEQKIVRLGYFQISAFLLTLFIAFILYLRLNKIVGPISQLKKAADAAKEGDLDKCLKHCRVKTGDEIEDLGETMHLMVQRILQNINELKKVDRMKSEFMSMVSHEMKTPLTAIIGFLSLLGKETYGKLTEEQKKTLSKINIQSKHLEDLISSVLDITRIEFGQELQIKREPTSIDQEINKAIEGMKPDFDKKEIKLETKIIPHLPTIVGDEAKIERIITSILGNALKFTPKNGVVELDARATEKEVIIKISDTGIGLAKDQLEKIFNKFYQVDSSITREYGGIGMGLTITRKIVEAHGGKIWTESEGPGKGATFIFTLPISG